MIRHTGRVALLVRLGSWWGAVVNRGGPRCFWGGIALAIIVLAMLWRVLVGFLVARHTDTRVLIDKMSQNDQYGTDRLE